MKEVLLYRDLFFVWQEVLFVLFPVRYKSLVKDTRRETHISERGERYLF